MSFSGKKFRRIACENVEELVKAANANENIIQILKNSVPTFCFTRLDEATLQMTVHCDDKVLSYTFRLGEETEIERRDGQKVKITYTLEGDSVLKQVIKQPDGKIAHFRREFGDKEAKMIVTMEGTDVQAKIYYKIVE